MSDDMNIDTGEKSSEKDEPIISAETAKYTKIVFTAVVVIFFLISIISSQMNSMSSDNSEPQPQNGSVTEQEIPESSDDVTETEAEEEETHKTVSDHLHDIKIGKSNILAFAVLGGALVYVQILRENGEKQKESK